MWKLSVAKYRVLSNLYICAVNYIGQSKYHKYLAHIRNMTQYSPFLANRMWRTSLKQFAPNSPPHPDVSSVPFWNFLLVLWKWRASQGRRWRMRRTLLQVWTGLGRVGTAPDHGCPRPCRGRRHWPWRTGPATSGRKTGCPSSLCWCAPAGGRPGRKSSSWPTSVCRLAWGLIGLTLSSWVSHTVCAGFYTIELWLVLQIQEIESRA